jgi:hypothetical protein
VTLALAASLPASPTGAQEAPAEEGASAVPEAELVEPAARAAVRRMVETLTGAQRMAYEYESEYDAIQDDGEMLEFGRRGAVTIRRPDGLRGEVWQRDGRHVRYAWDGQEVALYDELRNVYASTPRTGDLDGLIYFLREEVGFRMPVADLFSSDLRQMLIDHVVAARHVGKETLRDVETEHVALRLRSGVDVQLWIRAAEPAVPQRIALNFSTADGRPQFRADFVEWDLDPRVRDSLFELEAPKDAKRIPFMLPPRRAAGLAAEEEGR